METEAERTARLRLEMLEDSAQDAHRHLGHIISLQLDSVKADTVAANYYKGDGTWLWVNTDTTRLLHDIDSLARFLHLQAEDMGFSPDAFFTSQISQDIGHLRRMDFDSTATDPVATMATLEFNLSRAFLRYALGQRFGFVNPRHALNRTNPSNPNGRRVYDIWLEQADDDFIRQALSHAGDQQPATFLRQCETSSPLYAELKRRLASDSTGSGRSRIISNMERHRWRHRQQTGPGQRHIFVNIPAQQVWAIGPDSVFSMRICCGAWLTKTPLLESMVSRIEMNPEWRIPFTIMRDEVAGHAGDSAYFARNRYYAVEGATGQLVSPHRLSGEQLRSGRYRIIQHSGPRNSLGRLIFRFPNTFDVYLHDTNNRSAFNNDRRTISHGCVRVQRPFDMARFLLADNDSVRADQIRLAIGLKPETLWGRRQLETALPDTISPYPKTTGMGVEPKVPVAIDYYTLYPNPETGEWETWPDRYEYDQEIMRRIKLFLP